MQKIFFAASNIYCDIVAELILDINIIIVRYIYKGNNKKLGNLQRISIANSTLLDDLSDEIMNDQWNCELNNKGVPMWHGSKSPGKVYLKRRPY